MKNKKNQNKANKMKKVFLNLIYVFLGILLFKTFIPNLSEGFQTKTETLSKKEIPKIIIQTWKNKDTSRFKALQDSVKNYNPDFEYKFFTDEDIETFLKENYPSYLIIYNQLPIKIMKIDFFRYIAVYHYGGFYLDLDVECHKSLEPLTKYSCVFPIENLLYKHVCKVNKELGRYKNHDCEKYKYDVGQYAFGAAKNHPFLRDLVENIASNIDVINEEYKKIINSNKPDTKFLVYYSTGPDYVSHLYYEYKKTKYPSQGYNVELLHGGFDERTKAYNLFKFGEYGKHKTFGTWK